MKSVVTLVILALGCSAQYEPGRKFPDDFIFGVATASHQIEGAWNTYGKGENIWDHLTHNRPELIVDRSTADIAADSYHNYKRDVEMMRELGVDLYRFSIAWSRILPNGFSNEINQAGIEFYNNYIDEMLKYNITPAITLYHWDLPQKLQDLGGFLNPLVSDWFEDYARVVFEAFGDRVKMWITMNEPREVCFDGYGSVWKAPALNATGIGEYICAKNIALAHAKAYHLYNNEFKAKQGGVCGITFSVTSYIPNTDSDADKYAVLIKEQAESGIYIGPIFSKDGGFPEELSKRVAEKSKQQGFSKSRMPEFTEEEKAFVRGTADFLGVNHYSANVVSASEEHKNFNSVPSLPDDIDVGSVLPPEWAESASSWLYHAPGSLCLCLTQIANIYGPQKFYITENGWSTLTPGDLYDEDRVVYYRDQLESALDCIYSGIDLKGYMAWSLMDNFEWLQGYRERFGLYQVDFEDPARTRRARKSALVYKHIIKHRSIDYSYDPQDLTITIDPGH